MHAELRKDLRQNKINNNLNYYSIYLKQIHILKRNSHFENYIDLKPDCKCKHVKSQILPLNFSKMNTLMRRIQLRIHALMPDEIFKFVL